MRTEMTLAKQHDRVRQLLLEAQASRIMATSKGKRDDRVRMFRPGVKIENGNEFGWCSTEEADAMETEGLAHWAWMKRGWLVVDNLSSGIRGRSCSLSGVSRGYEPRMKTVLVPRGKDRGGKERFSKRQVPDLTAGDPMKDPNAGEFILDRCLSPLESFALDSRDSDSLLEHLGDETLVGPACL